MEQQEIEYYQKAGEIAKQVVAYAKSMIRPNMLLLEIADNIENKILELDGDIAFPVNLSVDEVAAHYTPSPNDEKLATGLLKIDLGVDIEGFVADTAFTLDLTEDKKHKEIIEITEKALENALDLIKNKKTNTQLTEIGKTIQETITSKGFSPITNLSGHSLDQNMVHAGITIPNCENNNKNTLTEGAFAVEPFATYGEGVVVEGGPSNIYNFLEKKPIRDPTARLILNWIIDYKLTLPFSLRDIEESFPNKARLGLSRLEQAGIIMQYPQLIERTKKPVTQAEHTFFINNNKFEITTN